MSEGLESTTPKKGMNLHYLLQFICGSRDEPKDFLEGAPASVHYTTDAKNLPKPYCHDVLKVYGAPPVLRSIDAERWNQYPCVDDTESSPLPEGSNSQPEDDFQPTSGNID